MYEKFMVKQIANCVSLSESESVWGDTAAAAVNQRSFRGGGLVTTGDPLVAAGEQCSAVRAAGLAGQQPGYADRKWK